MEILLAQLNLYFETDENVLPPLKIDLSADINDIQIVPKEPIAILISVLQAIYIKTALEDWEILNRIAITLESLCIRMARTELEHLNLVCISRWLKAVFTNNYSFKGIRFIIVRIVHNNINS